MDDTLCRRFFLEPTQPLHRRYAALHAFFVEGLSRPGHRRALRLDLSHRPLLGARLPGPVPRRPGSPLFAQPPRGRPRRDVRAGQPARPGRTGHRRLPQLSLAPGRRLRTRVAGIFLFLPLLARLRFDRLVSQAGYPGSEMVPAAAALLSLLALKLLDKERRSHIDDFNFDEALGLFAGLNVLPKKSFATDYSYRTSAPSSSGSCPAGSPAWPRCCSPRPQAFSLDFHPIPYRGDPDGPGPPLPAPRAARPARAC